MNERTLSPNEALERLFEVIREEATVNSKFASRMLDAVGIAVMFTGPEAVAVADPFVVAAKRDYGGFRQSFLSFKEADLKKVLQTYSLATKEQLDAVKKPKKDGYVDLLWEGAQRRLKARSAR